VVLHTSVVTRMSDTPRWYVLRILPRQDAVAEINLVRQGFRPFVPRVIVTKRHARKFETRREELFPRYGFVRLNLDADRWRSINGTYGVERLMMTREQPTPVPVGIVESLLACADQFGVVDLDRGLRVGSTVRIIAGPFAGAIGVLQRMEGRSRAELLLEMLNGSVRTHVLRESLEVV
jgi:transcriptional antiterminator RfaH